MTPDAAGRQQEIARSLFALGVTEARFILSLEEFRALPELQRYVSFVPDTITARIGSRECGEEMTGLEGYFRMHKSDCILSPGTAVYGARKETVMSLRSGAAERLLQAEKLLKGAGGKHLTFCITDAYRPLSLQRTYFAQINEDLHRLHGLTGQALYDQANMLISDPELFPPHSTGGTVDLTVFEASTGVALDMGTDIDAMDDPHIFAFHPAITPEQKRNRVLLFGSMTAAGFVGFPSEWWHFSYGDREWAMRTGQPAALYAPVLE